MKISEVPQDDIKTMQGEKKALYAVDDQGHYTKTTTKGWEVEEAKNCADHEKRVYYHLNR